MFLVSDYASSKLNFEIAFSVYYYNQSSTTAHIKMDQKTGYQRCVVPLSLPPPPPPDSYTTVINTVWHKQIYQVDNNTFEKQK